MKASMETVQKYHVHDGCGMKPPFSSAENDYEGRFTIQGHRIKRVHCELAVKR